MVPPILILAASFAGLIRMNAKRILWSIGLQIFAALVYTTPWDNYLVFKGIWIYGEGRVVGTLGYVPIEEYIFFLLQPIFTGLLTVGFLRNTNLQFDRPPLFSSPRAVGFFLAMTCLGVVALFKESTLYLGLILAWGAPVLGFHWFIGGALLKKLWLPLTKTILVSTAYLWFCDIIALREKIWSISEVFTTGIFIGSYLPIEEALFFLLTNVLVVQGVALFLYDDGLKPLERWTGRLPNWRARAF
jgi:lycopene cyclase domain-containing protein